MKYALLLLPFVLLLAACTKERDTAQVRYLVKEVSTEDPSFEIEYASPGGPCAPFGLVHYINGWESQIMEFQEGKDVWLKVRSYDSCYYEFQLSIFVDGQLFKTGTLYAGMDSLKIHGRIPKQ